MDRLIRNICRGTGHDFGGKNGFIQEANRVLSDIGYMLVVGFTLAVLLTSHSASP